MHDAGGTSTEVSNEAPTQVESQRAKMPTQKPQSIRTVVNFVALLGNGCTWQRRCRLVVMQRDAVQAHAQHIVHLRL